VLQRDNLALHHAAMKGHADIIRMLIKAGSHIDAQDKVRQTLINVYCMGVKT
jgi:ankyrin repeat protein